MGLWQAAKNVNGLLLHKLAKETSFHDVSSASMFREGCDLIGPLTRTGNGRPLDTAEARPVESLHERRKAQNMALLANLKEDCRAEDLHQMAHDDADLKRMTHPRPVSRSDVEEYTFSPRFCIEQGYSLCVWFVSATSPDICARRYPQ